MTTLLDLLPSTPPNFPTLQLVQKTPPRCRRRPLERARRGKRLRLLRVSRRPRPADPPPPTQTLGQMLVLSSIPRLTTAFPLKFPPSAPGPRPPEARGLP